MLKHKLQVLSLFTLALVMTLALGAGIVLDTAPSFAQSDEEVNARVDQAMRHLTGYLGRSSTITRQSHFWRWSQNVYGDTGLGCPLAGVAYTQQTIRGYRIIITVDEIEYDYRATPSGDILVLCGPDGQPLYRSDTPVTGSPPQQATPTAAPQSSRNTSAVQNPWLAWLYMDGNDLMYLLSPNGLELTMKRPSTGTEGSPLRPTMAISPGGQYMVQTVNNNFGGQTLSFYNFAQGDIYQSYDEPQNINIGLGFGPGFSYAHAGSPNIFNPQETRVAIGYSSNDYNSPWRLTVYDLASGGVINTLLPATLASLLPNNFSDAVNNANFFAPRVYYYDNQGGIHVQMIPQGTEGSSEYAAFVWYPDSNTATLSPYIYSAGDVLTTSGQVLYPYLDPNATYLEPNGPFPATNALAQGVPVGASLNSSNVYRNSNFYFFGGQWASSDASLTTFILDDGITQNYVIYDPAIAAQNNFLPQFLPTDVVSTTGINGSVLAIRSDNVGAQNVTQFFANSQPSIIWNVPPRVGEAHMIWALDPGASITVPYFELSIWGQGGTGASNIPTNTVQNCAGTIPSQVALGDRARVTFTDGTPLRLRATPGTTGTFLRDMQEGTPFTIIGGPSCVDGYTWWQVQLDNGSTGWAAEGDPDTYFMEPLNS